MSNTVIPPNPSEDEISFLAWHLWESAGRPTGRDLDFWLQAESQLAAALTLRIQPLQILLPNAEPAPGPRSTRQPTVSVHPKRAGAKPLKSTAKARRR